MNTDANVLSMILGGGKPKIKAPRKPSKPRVTVGKRVCAWGREFGIVTKIEKDAVTIMQDNGSEIVRIKCSCVVTA